MENPRFVAVRGDLMVVDGHGRPLAWPEAVRVAALGPDYPPRDPGRDIGPPWATNSLVAVVGLNR